MKLPQRVLHLSDLHLTESGKDEDGVDADAALAQILHDCRHLAGIDVVVVSGDVSDDGSVGGYRRALDQIGPFAAQRSIPRVFSTGNHDDRAAFSAVLGSGHLGPDGSDLGHLIGHADLRAAVSEVDGLRMITLDSLVVGSVHGTVCPTQLEWLRDQLATPAPAGSLVVVHHPPIALSDGPMRSVVLRDPEALGEALAGSDVRAVLCGHLHHQLSGALGAVPVWVTPGVVTRVDATAPAPVIRAVLGASATLIELGAGHPTFQVLHARQPDAGHQVYLYDQIAGAYVTSETTG